VAIWPALNFTAHNWADVGKDGAAALAGVALISLGMGAIGHAFHYWMSRRNRGGFSVVCAVVAVGLFFGYSLIHDSAAALIARLGLTLAPSLGWLLVLVILSAVVILLRKHEGLQVAATVFCFSAAALALGQLIVTAMSAPTLRAQAPATGEDHLQRVQPNTAGLNVYYMLLDEYSGQAGLREFTDFDNSPFIGEMVRRGFIDATSIDPKDLLSNYLITQQTLASIFALDYTLTEDPQTWREPWRLFPYSVDGAQVPPLIREFESAGYSVWQTFNTWVGCSGRHMRCLGGHGSMDFDYMTMAFVAPTPLGRAAALWLGRRVDGLVAIATHLPILEASRQSRFVFVHSLVTHPPYFLGADCEPRDMSQLDFDAHKHDRKAYVGSVKCANRKVLELVDRISKIDPTAIIVVQGDHGSEFTVNWDQPISSWPDSSIRERGSFLNLIKAPPRCAPWLDRSLAQVNTARFVLGCVRGRSPQYLPQRTYLSSYTKIDGNYVIVPLDRQVAQRN